MTDDHFRGTAAAALLCAAAGFADAVGFVHMNVFAANMTGNTVLAGLALAHQDWGAMVERLMTLVTFFGGAMLGRWLLRLGRNKPAVPLLGEAVLLALSLQVDPKNALSIWLIAAAMGVQATALTKFRGAAVSTVVITSTMARLAESAADLLAAPFGLQRGPAGSPASLLLTTWVFYGVGALLAALLMPRMAEPLILPVAMVLGLSVWFWLADRKAKLG